MKRAQESFIEYPTTTGTVIHGDNLPTLKDMVDKSFTLIYVDPPFNTDKVQTRAEHTPAAGDQPAARGE